MAVHFSGELQVPDWKKGWRNPSSMVMKHVREKLDLLKGRHIDDRGGEWRPYKKRSRWRLTTCGWLCLTTVRPVSEGNCLALRLTMSDDSQTSLSKQPSGVRQMTMVASDSQTNALKLSGTKWRQSPHSAKNAGSVPLVLLVFCLCLEMFPWLTLHSGCCFIHCCWVCQPFFLLSVNLMPVRLVRACRTQSA